MSKPENAPEEPGSEKATAAKARYSHFFEKNPDAKLLSFEHEGEERLAIVRPWGDRSIGIGIPDDDAALVEGLNSLYLPPRYTAVYHFDKRVLEVIWTAYKLDDTQLEVQGRKFNLTMPGAAHQCEFAESSERLLEIARNIMPLGISSTGFRNLQSFHNLLNRGEAEPEEAELEAYGTPLSFWISNVDWDDDQIIHLIRHINFYLRYYDAQSPVVEIHPLVDNKASPRNRYFEGFGFPTEITSPTLDTKLLIMYSSLSSAPSTKFLNMYRVVEYVSFDYMHEVARKQLKSIISKPHALHDIEKTSTNLMLILREIKTEREQEAISRFLKEVILPDHLWREMEPNKAFFTTATNFEGGLRIDPIATDKTSGDTFGHAGVEAFARACTKIRNGLAHGRDKISADSILPIARNFDLLRPWLNGLQTCAGEVVLYAGRH